MLVARAFSGEIEHLAGLIVQAVEHKGFALIDVFQPCVTWNHLNTTQWFRNRVYKLDETGYDPSDKVKAFELTLTTDGSAGSASDASRTANRKSWPG